MEKKLDGTSVIAFLFLMHSVLAVEVKPSINPAVVGGTVTLSLSPSVTLKAGSWAVGESQILTWLGDQQAVFSGYTGRAFVNTTTGALTLSLLSIEDSGLYWVQSSDPKLTARASVSVVEPVSNVSVSVNQSCLTEFQHSAHMKCSMSTGSSLRVVWMNRSSEVTASDRVLLSQENSMLTIPNVTRYDSGPFRCSVFNPVSNGTSDAVNFIISYGPDNMALTVNGLNISFFPSGSNLTMLCAADSNPPAQLQWAFRGKLLNRTDTLLKLHYVVEAQSGPYSCLAFNNHTQTHNHITTHIVISNSGSEHQALNVLLFTLLSLAGLGPSLPDVCHSFRP
ncbi:cell adhesion molecule CEACAM5-like [Menidia menidia]